MGETPRLCSEPIDVEAVRRVVAAPECGAVALFCGVVRNHHEGRAVSAIDYEAYAGMAEKEIAGIEAEIRERWPGCRVRIVHRVGRLTVGEVSVVVAAATPHRAEAFDACRHGIERIKQLVPIWKAQEG